MSKFPSAYLNDVPMAGTAPGIEVVPQANMDIGARKSGMPKFGKNGTMGIDHVGGRVGGRSK